jgi:hypothetical protein
MTYRFSMKTELRIPMMATAAAVAAMFFTGCATMNQSSAGASTAGSALAFAPVTDPEDLVKWSGSRFENGLRTFDTYTFVVPDTGYRPGSDYLMSGYGDMDTSDSEYREAAGTAPALQTESASGGYRIIQHHPGQR